MISALTALRPAGHLPEFAMTQPTAAQTPAAKQDFGSMLAQLGSTAINTVKQAEVAALQGMQGSLPVQQVVDQVLAAERTLQAGLAIRDKLVTAFLDISRMQI